MAKGGSARGDKTAKGGKEYASLTPFERAVMLMEAAERTDGKDSGALGPVTLYDCLHIALNCLGFHILAFSAVHESQRGDALYWASLAMMRQQIAEGGERKDGTDLKTWQERIQDGKRRGRAWILALEALDKETGGACMPCARIFAGEYISIIKRDADKETDYSVELERLREIWAANRGGLF